MKKLVLALALSAPLWAGDFQVRPPGTRPWRVLSTEHLDVFIDDPALEARARRAAAVLEEFHERAAARLKVDFQRRTPVFLYKNHNRFEATTTIGDPGQDEGVGAFTEAFRNRLVLPVYPGGFYEHVLRHEYVHVAEFNEYVRSRGYDLLKIAIVMADWFMEGFAEYLSGEGLSVDDDRWLRDLVVSGRMRPLDQYFAFDHLNPGEVLEAYTLGHAVFIFLDETYGPGTPERLFRFYGHLASSHEVLRRATGEDFIVVQRRFAEWMRTRYARQAEGRTPPPGRRLSRHGEDYYRVFDLSPRELPGGGVAFISTRQDVDNIYVQSAEGDERALLGWDWPGRLEEIHRRGTGIDVSPDGRWLACVGEYGLENRLTLLALEGDRRRELELDFDDVYSPAFSPDGRRLAFSGQRAGQTDIYSVALDAPTDIQRHTRDEGHDNHPAWSPDGRWIYYDHEEEAGRDLYRVAGAGEASPERLTETRGSESEPHPSPDGLHVLHVFDGQGTADIARLDLATHERVLLTRLVGAAASPRYSRDGRRIIYSAYENGRWNIHEAAIDELKTGPAGDQAQPAADELKGRDDRRARLDRIAQAQAPQTFDPYRPELGLEAVLPLGIVNTASAANLPGDQQLELNLGPVALEGDLDGDGRDDSDDEGFGADLTWLDRSRPIDLRATLYHAQQDASTSHREDISETQSGYLAGARYALTADVALGLAYTGFKFVKRYQFREHLDVDHWLNGLVGDLTLDRLRGRGLTVTGGSLLTLQGGYFDEALGGVSRFTALGAEGQYFRSIVQDHVMALRLRGQKSYGEDIDRFDLGGFNGLRGLRSNRIEGANLALSTLEYRFPLGRDINREHLATLIKDLRGVIFSDQGWASDERRGLQADDLVHAVGAGLRIDLFIIQRLPVPLALEVLRRTDRHADAELRLGAGIRF